MKFHYEGCDRTGRPVSGEIDGAGAAAARATLRERGIYVGALREATRAVDLPIASACGENGACARCGLEIVAGADAIAPETEREETIKARNRIDATLRLACRVHPRGDMTVRATYW